MVALIVMGASSTDIICCWTNNCYHIRICPLLVYLARTIGQTAVCCVSIEPEVHQRNSSSCWHEFCFPSNTRLSLSHTFNLTQTCHSNHVASKGRKPITRWRSIMSQKNAIRKSVVPPLVKKSLAFYGTRQFIAVFNTARHWSPCWASCILFMPSYTRPRSLRSVLILSSHLSLDLPNGLFLSVYPPKSCMYIPSSSSPFVPHVLPIVPFTV